MLGIKTNKLDHAQGSVNGNRKLQGAPSSGSVPKTLPLWEPGQWSLGVA
jgi:hypothetical protein